jgi:hypothetical protein
VSVKKALALELGEEVHATDGFVGTLNRVVLASEDLRVTEIVVRTPDDAAERRVPLVWCAASNDRIALDCTRAEFSLLASTCAHPVAPGADAPDSGGTPHVPFLVIVDPSDSGDLRPFDLDAFGDVGVRAGRRVFTRGGYVGDVCGVLADLESHHLCQLLLEEDRALSR